MLKQKGNTKFLPLNFNIYSLTVQEKAREENNKEKEIIAFPLLVLPP
jgi:hypothetical protein